MTKITGPIAVNEIKYIQRILGRTGGYFNPFVIDPATVEINGVANTAQVWVDIVFESGEPRKFSTLRYIVEQPYF